METNDVKEYLKRDADGVEWMFRAPEHLQRGADEVWEEVPGAEGLWVSTHGSIQYKFKERMTNPHVPNADAYGYHKFRYKPPGYAKWKTFGVHDCVALAFLGARPNEKCTADHIDYNRSNNHVWNLRWETPEGQHLHRRNLGTRHEARPCRGKPVGASDNEWTEYESVYRAGEHAATDPGTIRKICNKEYGYNTSAGYVFEWMSSTEPEHIDGEEWKRYKNSQNMVSNMGRIKKIKSGWIYTPKPVNDAPYAFFSGRLFHRIVCELFCEAPKEGETSVDHIDTDKSNNKASNLRWANPGLQRSNQNRREAGDGFKDSTKKRVRVTYSDGSTTTFLGLGETSRQVKMALSTIGGRIRSGYAGDGVKFEYV